MKRLDIIFSPVFAWADRQSFVYGAAGRDAEHYFSDVWSVRGVLIYKTKGTVLVFSWCGSGSIMPHKDQERKRKIRKGSCSSARWWHSGRAVIRIFFRVVCAQLLRSTNVKGSTLLLFQNPETTKIEKLTALFSVYRYMFIYILCLTQIWCLQSVS